MGAGAASGGPEEMVSERERASEKPNQQLLLIMDIHMVEGANGKTNILEIFPVYLPKEFVKNENSKLKMSSTDIGFYFTL